jgi:hypothetical protein
MELAFVLLDEIVVRTPDIDVIRCWSSIFVSVRASCGSFVLRSKPIVTSRKLIGHDVKSAGMLLSMDPGIQIYVLYSYRSSHTLDKSYTDCINPKISE